MRVYDGAAGREVDLDHALAQLATRDVVLVGETHLDAETHRLEHVLFEGLAARRPGQVTLSLEMFERNAQPPLDDYLAGRIDEAAFLATSSPWSNYVGGYRPLVEAARARQLPVVASNLPIDVRRLFAMEGVAALDKLTPEQKAWLPTEVFPPEDAYWARLEGQLRDHGHGMGGSSSPDDRLYAVQNLWDNTMADAIVKASAEDRLVVHFAGAFHVEYGLGIAAQIHKRDPELELSTVSIVATPDLTRVDPAEHGDRADYVVIVQEIARGPSGGTHGVQVPSELRYRLFTPPEPARERPLLVWLPEDGALVEDELRFWRLATDEAALVAVLEPPHREVAPDLRVASRWHFRDTYEEDQARVTFGLERILDYLGAYHAPSDRVLVGGRGSGAAAALWAGFFQRTRPLEVLALEPVAAARFGEVALPRNGSKLVRATVLADEVSVQAIDSTLSAVNVPLVREPIGDRLHDVVHVRAALGLPPLPDPTGEVRVRIDGDTPLARQWQALYALTRRVKEGVAVTFDPQAEPVRPNAAAFASGKALPIASGPFGGTTVLVVPDDLLAAEREAWQAIADGDAIKTRTRFASLRITDAAGLTATLQAIRDAGRRSVLIVPAVFVAEPAHLRALHDATEAHRDVLDLEWLPGLGGALSLALSQE